MIRSLPTGVLVLLALIVGFGGLLLLGAGVAELFDGPTVLSFLKLAAGIVLLLATRQLGRYLVAERHPPA